MIAKRDVGFRILEYLFKGKIDYSYKIRKEIGCTFGSCHNNIKNLIEEKLIVYEKNNCRNKYIKITKKGIEVFKLLNRLKKLICSQTKPLYANHKIR